MKDEFLKMVLYDSRYLRFSNNKRLCSFFTGKHFLYFWAKSPSSKVTPGYVLMRLSHALSFPLYHLV